MQYSFDYGDSSGGGPRRPRYPERLIFMFRFDGETSARAIEIGQRALRNHRIDAALLRADRLHVSLYHIGDYKRLPSPIVYASKLAGNAVSMKPFEITFPAIKSFEAHPRQGGSPRWPLVLLGKGDGLIELHKLLGHAMGTMGLPAGDHFVPHMTLSYGPRPVPLQSIEPLRFMVAGFELIHSRLGLTEYRTLDQWALAA